MKATGLVMALLALMGMAAAARADWVHRTEDDPFNGDSHVVMGITDESGYVVGFRCTAKEGLSLIYLTPEEMGSDSKKGMDAMNLMAGLKLLVIVDDEPKLAFDAMADSVASNHTLRFAVQDDGLSDLVEKVKAAKKRMAVAVNMEAFGKTIHTKSFDVRGSRRALDELTAGCKIKDGK